jgi:hypothetical protein
MARSALLRTKRRVLKRQRRRIHAPDGVRMILDNRQTDHGHTWIPSIRLGRMKQSEFNRSCHKFSTGIYIQYSTGTDETITDHHTVACFLLSYIVVSL